MLDEFCRLCGGATLCRFNLVVLEKYSVQYSECMECKSLQTEHPYWLEESYKHNLSNLDTGAAQRNLNNFSACYIVSKIFNVNNLLDFGGGDGLLCRFLRDYGLNCFVNDKFSEPSYAQGYTIPNFDTPGLVTAFEVLEHFENPDRNLDELFAMNPKILMVSTEIYSSNPNNWWYLAPKSGQHIFFYSREALELIATKYHCKLIINDGYILFIKNEFYSFFKATLSKIMLNKIIQRISRSIIILMPTKSIWDDYLSQSNKSDN